MFKKIMILLCLILLAFSVYFFMVSKERKNSLLKDKEIYEFGEFLEKNSMDYTKKYDKDGIIEYYLNLNESEELNYKFKYAKQEKKGNTYTISSNGKTIIININYKSKNRLAILIDDVSMKVDTAYDFLKIDQKLTFAAIPFTPNMKKAKKILEEGGFPVILHMPMESKGNEYLNAKTKGLIRTNMSKDEIERKFLEALDDVGEVEGFNNHMGSKFTGDKGKMSELLDIVKKKNLYYIDSNTNTKSIAFTTAKEKEIKTYFCSIFLDNEKDVEYIKERIKLAVERTKKNQKVIAIGHYHKATAQAIQEMLPFIEEQGVDLVYVKELLE